MAHIATDSVSAQNVPPSGRTQARNHMRPLQSVDPVSQSFTRISKPFLFQFFLGNSVVSLVGLLADRFCKLITSSLLNAILVFTSFKLLQFYLWLHKLVACKSEEIRK